MWLDYKICALFQNAAISRVFFFLKWSCWLGSQEWSFELDKVWNWMHCNFFFFSLFCIDSMPSYNFLYLFWKRLVRPLTRFFLSIFPHRIWYSPTTLSRYLHYVAYSRYLDPIIRGCYNLLFDHAWSRESIKWVILYILNRGGN